MPENRSQSEAQQTWSVTIWGGTGSLPASLNHRAVRRKLVHALRASRDVNLDTEEALATFVDTLPFAVRGTYGGNTSCVELSGGDDLVILDAGSGLRDLSAALMGRAGAVPGRFHILLSHLHWDHLQGFPFFTPAYIAGNVITIYSAHAGVERAMRAQSGPPVFPVDFSELAADIRFVHLDPTQSHAIGGFAVRMIEQDHPGRSYGYRLERGGKTLVYSTDAEHREGMYDDDYPFLDFFRNADVLIFDAQYSHVEAVHQKADWGHASNLAAVELAARSGVKQLCLFHREPMRSDEELDDSLTQTQRYAGVFENADRLRITRAYDGLRLDP